MSKRKCTVVRECLTLDDVRKIRENQQNVRKVDSENDKGTALEKAKRGSEIYLKAQGYVKIKK